MLNLQRQFLFVFSITVLLPLLVSKTVDAQVAKGAHFCAITPPHGEATGNLEQADGSFLKVKVNNRPPLDYLTTADGYTVLKDKNGFFKYAQLNDMGSLIPTDVIAHNEQERSITEHNFLQNLSKNIQYQGVERSARLANHQKMGSSGPDLIFPPTGNQKALLILVNYTDQNATYSVSDFNALANQSGYSVNGQSGSFRDFYEDISCGQLTLNTDVNGWHTSNNSRATYGYGQGFGAAGNLIREAIDAAEAGGLDFSQYDGDDNGSVDVVMVIHSGRGREESGDNNDIWSHRWQLTATGNQVVYDGVLINDYIIQPEKLGPTDITNIGVLCHEFGHALGLPDLYDTDYSSSGIGRWGLMAGGSWNNNGRTPAHMSAWCKQQIGWTTPTVLENCGTSISDIDFVDNSCGAYYRINTPISSQYFLLENRQQQGWDTNIPGSGLLIWHIDEAQIDANDNSNTVNGNDEHYGVHLEQADGISNLNNGSNQGDTGDPFPGISNNTTFNNNSSPNSRTYDNAPSNICVYNIAVNGSTVSFDWEKSGDLQLLQNTVSPLSLSAGESIDIETDLTNDAGCTDVAASTLTYYLSTDNVVDNADTNLGSDAITAISAGSIESVTKNISIPANTSNGSWFICTQADANNNIDECEENNNENCIQIQVQATSSCLAQVGTATSNDLVLCELGNVSNLSTTYSASISDPGADYTKAYVLLNVGSNLVLNITSTNFFNNLTAGNYCIRSLSILTTDISILDISNLPQTLADFTALNNGLCWDIEASCNLSFNIDADTDGDGFCGTNDNCLTIFNDTQSDEDNDGIGDACDVCYGDNVSGDSDEDGICDDEDNCPQMPNADQADSDGDGTGDVCDVADPCDGLGGDTDGDGICNDDDNCPDTFNDAQEDTDNDGVGDPCDICDGNDASGDTDGDGICDNIDNCPNVPNNVQGDSNANGVGDDCENTCTELGGDSDEDGVCDDNDNCPETPNADQADSNNNGIGDVCESNNGCSLVATLEKLDGSSISVLANWSTYHIDIKGGTPPYNYYIASVDGAIRHALLNTTIKVYASPNTTFEFIITDSGDCEISIANETTGGKIHINNYEIRPQTSINEDNGEINLQVQGGDGDYTFEWSGTSCPCGDAATASGLALGWYAVTVTDGSGSEPAYGWYWVPRSRGGRGKLQGQDEKLSTYPNPAQDKTMIEFELPYDAVVYLDLYNLSGQHIADVINVRASRETVYSATLSVADLPVGIYLLRLKTSTGNTTYQKVVVSR